MANQDKSREVPKGPIAKMWDELSGAALERRAHDLTPPAAAGPNMNLAMTFGGMTGQERL